MQVNMQNIVKWLQRTGLAAQSVATLAPSIPRMERRLAYLGVTEIPASPMVSRGASDDYANNLLNLFVCQAMPVRDSGREHRLRDLTRTRPFKG